MILEELVYNLFMKSGLPKDHEFLTTISESKKLADIEVPDDVAQQVEGNLYTYDSASSNPKIKSKLFAEAMNGVDAELDRTMDELGFDEELKNEIKAEKSTPKRAALLTKKVKELESAKAKTSDKGDKSELQNQINTLNAEKSRMIADMKSEKDSLLASHENDITSLLVNNSLASFNYGLGDVPKETAILAARLTIDNAMKQEGIRTVREDNTLKLVRNDGTDYYDKAQNQVDYKSFVERTLASNKLLKTTEPAKQEPGKTILNNSKSKSSSWNDALDTAIQEASAS